MKTHLVKIVLSSGECREVFVTTQEWLDIARVDFIELTASDDLLPEYYETYTATECTFMKRLAEHVGKD